MYGRLKQDESCHWYLVPEELCEKFSQLSDAYGLAGTIDEEEKICAEFIGLFDEHRINAPGDLRIPMNVEVD